MLSFFWLALGSLGSAHALPAPLPEGVYSSLLKKFALVGQKQSFCYSDETLQAEGSNIDQRVIPASVTKAYTTYVALKKYGPDFRFKTRFEVSTGPSGSTLHISGDHDGYFVNEQVFLVLNLLEASGIRKLHDLTFDSKFYLNFNLDPSSVRFELLKLFKTASWSAQLKSEYQDFVRRAKALNLPVSDAIPALSVYQIRSDEHPGKNAEFSFTLSSAPLIRLLKEMNVHSTNRFAKSVFVRIGNPAEFNSILYEDLDTREEHMRFSDGSGGQANYTTCRVTLKLFKALETLLSGYAMQLSDAISVAGMDGGTLGKRFNQSHNSGSVMGKTGTLPDIGVSTLAGKVSTQGSALFYGIFNRYTNPNLASAKGLQNDLIDQIIEAHSGKKDLEHTPWSFDVLQGLTID